MPDYHPPPEIEYPPIAYTIYAQLRSAYPDECMAVQLRRSLERQRRVGVSFPIAWARATGHLLHQHERSERDVDRELLNDPGFVRIWAAAYARKPLRAFDAIARLQAVLEPADVRDAPRREPSTSQRALLRAS